jgi:hypothetical protein
MNRTIGKILLVGLAAGVSLAAACGSNDEAPLGRRAEHPDPRAPRPVSSVNGAVDASHPPPEGPFSPLDKAIAEDCLIEGEDVMLPSRPWSQSVPDRDCTSDGECGDGFCARGRCAAIWTCAERFGQRCINGEVAPHPRFKRRRCDGICLEGRCRSCVSDEECIQELGHPDAECERFAGRSGGGTCVIGRLGMTIDRPVPNLACGGAAKTPHGKTVRIPPCPSSPPWGRR